MTTDHDPLLGSITAYTQTVECMAYCYGGSPRLEVDEWPDDNCVVKWSDLPDLIARVRADERQQARQRVEAIEHWASYSPDGDVWACYASDPATAAGGDA